MLRVASLYYPAMGFEGKGMGLIIYFQGCHNRCEGCHNQSLQPFEGGTEYASYELIEHIKQKYDPGWLDSVVLSGGEPLHQDRDSLERFMRFIKEEIPKAEIWLYTSYLKDRIPEYIRGKCDYIVDGPFMKEQYEHGLKFRGSKNQRVWMNVADIDNGDTMWRDVTPP